MADRVIVGIQKAKSIESIAIDAFLEETHGAEADVTEYAVENAESISDHIVLNPKTLDLECVVGVPLKEGSEDRWRDVYQSLLDLRESKKLLTVVTGLLVYTDMAMLSFSVPRSAGEGQGLSFSMSFRHVRVVKSQSTEIPKSMLGGTTGDVRQAQQGEAQAGRSPTTPVEEEKKQSFLDPIRANVDAAFGSPAW